MAVEQAISILSSSSAIDEAKMRGIRTISDNVDSLLALFTSESSKPALLIKELFDSLQAKLQ